MSDIKQKYLELWGAYGTVKQACDLHQIYKFKSFDKNYKKLIEYCRILYRNEILNNFTWNRNIIQKKHTLEIVIESIVKS